MTDTAAPTVAAETSPLLSSYRSAVNLVEVMHRRLFDLIADELERHKVRRITAVQAYLCFQIGPRLVTATEMREQGFYLGTNVSYNVNKLMDLGYLEIGTIPANRRVRKLKLTEKGLAVARILDDLFARNAAILPASGDVSVTQLEQFIAAGRKLQQFWIDNINYRR